MTTALDVIKRSMRLLGVYAIGEEPSDSEARDGLTALNALMDSLANDNLMVYAKTLDSISLTAGQASVTVGPSGQTITTRPVEVLDDSYLLIGNISYPLRLFTDDEYNGIAIKSYSGLPGGLWVQQTYPDITVNIWPQSSQAAILKLWSNKIITSFSGLTTSVALPPGYERMLAYLLAIELAPEFQVEPSATVIRVADASRRKLKRTNAQIPQMDMPYGVPSSPVFIDIRAL